MKVILALLIFCMVALIPVNAFEISVFDNTNLTPNCPVLSFKIDKVHGWDLAGESVWIKCYNQIAGEVTVVFMLTDDRRFFLGYWDHEHQKVNYVTLIDVGEEVKVKTWLDEDGYLHMGLYYGDLLLFEQKGMYYEGASKNIDKVVIEYTYPMFVELKVKSYGFSYVEDVLWILLPVMVAIALIGALVRKIQV